MLLDRKHTQQAPVFNVTEWFTP